MSESQKGASSPAAMKGKPTLLDGDIGKEFLSSWKSMSVSKDSSMDFQLETVNNGKSKAFNFNKMDMDFSLDGAFDKISSFKVDMSDLDFSCAPKKSGKNKEISKDSISGIHHGKQDHFNFSFDFNELDSFKFDSSSIEEQISNHCQDSKGTESNETVYQGFKNLPSEGVSAFGDGITEAPGMNSEIMSKVESSMSGIGNLDSRNDNCPSKSATFVNEDVSHGTTLPETTIRANTEVDQQSHPSKEGTPTELHAKQIVQGWPVLPVCGNDSIQHTVTEQQTEMHVTNTEENVVSGREKIFNARKETIVGPNCEKSPLKDSPSTPITGPESHDSEVNRMTSDNYIPFRITDAPEQGHSDIDHRDTFVANVSNDTRHDKAIQERQNSPSELPSAPLSSGNSQQTEGEENGQSRFFKTLVKAQFQPLQAVPICSGGITKIGAMHLTTADQRRDDIKPNASQNKNKAVARSLTQGFIECKAALLGNEKNIKDGERESTGIVDAQKKGKLVGNSVRHHREATEDEPSLLKNKIKDSTTFSFQLNGCGTTGQTSASCTQRCLTPKLLVSRKETSGNSIISSCGGAKISPSEASKKITDLSSLKSLRTRAMPNDLSNSTLQKQPKSLQNSEQEKQRQENVALKAVYSIGPEKQTTPTSLKRKALKDVDDLLTLNRRKRLLESIDGSRQIKDTSETLAVEQVCSNANMGDCDTKNVNDGSPKSSWELHMEVNLSEFEIPSVIESDKNIEKAEACTKELEDICNMLKKKHEEAKELLVRAIVNNNNLLMLNHPVYEEKFQALQKAAARLTLKEVQT